MASIYERQNDWAKVAEHYQSYPKKYGRQALPNEEIRANVQIGVAMWNQNKKPDAEKFFKAATKLWNSGAPAAIEKLANGDADKAAKWAAEGSQATAQALWYLANTSSLHSTRSSSPSSRARRTWPRSTPGQPVRS